MGDLEAAVGRAWWLRVGDTPMPAHQLATLVLSAMEWCIERTFDPATPPTLALINCFGKGMAGPLPRPLHALLPRLRHLSLSRHMQLPPEVHFPALTSLVVTNVAVPCRDGLPTMLRACPALALLSIGGVDDRTSTSASADGADLLGPDGKEGLTTALDEHASLAVLEITFLPAAEPVRAAVSAAHTRYAVRADEQGPCAEAAHLFDRSLLPTVAPAREPGAAPRPIAVWDFMDAGSLAVPPLPAAAAARVRGFAGDAASCADAGRQAPLHRYAREGREADAVALVRLGCPVHTRDKRRACAAG